VNEQLHRYHLTQNPANSPFASPELTERVLTRITGSSEARTSFWKTLSASRSPSATISTDPSGLFFTKPHTPATRAQPVTKYRNPTPWTLPRATAVIRFITCEDGDAPFNPYCFYPEDPGAIPHRYSHIGWYITFQYCNDR